MPKGKSTRILFYITAAIFVACVPLCLFTSNIRWVANNLPLYEYGFDKYYVSQDTGFSDEELIDISKELIYYFNSGKIGETMDIFSGKEITHLRDVRGLIQLCYDIQWITLGYIAVFSTAGFIYRRRQFSHSFNMAVAAGSIVGIIGVAALGIAALVDFDRLFIVFHHIFFRNKLWISSGYLPHIYTEGFFSDAGTIIAVTTILESLFIGVIAGFFILRRRRLMS